MPTYLFRLFIYTSSLVFSIFVFTQVLANELSAEAPKPQKIVVSLKPYALLVESIKRESDEVSVLVEDGANAHDFQLRPSHLKKIAEADLVIWSGENAEPTLAKVLKNKKQLKLLDVPNLDLIHTTEAEAHEHESHDNIDSHIWFSSSNALLMANAMAEALYYSDEALSNISVEIDKLQKHENYQPSNTVLVVYHNAYAYLEKDLKIQHSFVINESHNSKPSLRHWNSLKENLKNYKENNRKLCIVTQPGFAQSSEAKQLEHLLNSAAIKEQTQIIEIDPLASTKKFKDYFEFYMDSKNRLLNCLEL